MHDPSSSLSGPLLAVAASTALFAVGCGNSDCSAEYRMNQVSITRAVAVAAGTPIEVEACVRGACATAAPAAEGALAFPELSLGAIAGPTGGSLTRQGAELRVRVDLRVGETNAPDTVVLRARANGATVLDESATLTWTDTECHPEPTKVDL